MSMELFYTSAPQGLKPGTRGFCTVAMTEGIPAPLVERLELLSGYRPIFAPDDPNASRNPVVFAHWRLAVGRGSYSVLSRVCFAGFDYTRRSNKFAHHLVLSTGELVAGGPAWLMLQPGMMDCAWSGEPRIIPTSRAIAQGGHQTDVCSAWAQVTGDAGWGGVLADAFTSSPSKPCSIIFEPGTDLLPLIDDAIRLLPPERRWAVTFSTYFTEQPAGLNCLWRCCVAGTPAAREAIKLSALTIDLTRPLGQPPPGPMVQMARTGQAATGAAESPVEDDTTSFRSAGTQESAGVRPRPASPFASSRRLVNREPEPYAVGGAQSDADQSWMPPFDATVVERDEDDSLPAVVAGKGRGGRGAMFWVVAILWPVVVGTVVCMTIRPTGDGAARKEIAELKSRLDKAEKVTAELVKENEANERLATAATRAAKDAKDELTKRDKALAQATTRATELETEVAKQKTEIDGRDRTIAGLKKENAKLTSDVNKLTNDLKAKSPTMLGDTNKKDLPRVPDGIKNPPVPDKIEPKLTWPEPKGLAAVEEKPEPITIEGGDQQSWKGMSLYVPKAVEDKWQFHRLPGDQGVEIRALGGSTPVVLELKLENGKLLRQIRATGSETDDLVTQVKSMAVICLYAWNGKEWSCKAYQFRQPQPKPWTLAEALRLEDLYGRAGEAIHKALAGSKLELHADKDQGDKTVGGSGSTKLIVSFKQRRHLSITIELQKAQGLSSDAGTTRTGLHAAREQLDRDSIPKAKDAERVAQNAVKNAPKDDAALNDLQKKRQDLRDLNQKRADLLDDVKVINEFKAFDIRVVLENGATIAIVTVKPPGQ